MGTIGNPVEPPCDVEPTSDAAALHAHFDGVVNWIEPHAALPESGPPASDNWRIFTLAGQREESLVDRPGEELCPDCKGRRADHNGVHTCPTCGGDGYVPMGEDE